MFTINDVRKYIESVIAPLSTADDLYVRSFLSSLENGDVNSQRLLICLGIDLKNHQKQYGNGKEFLDFNKLAKEVILQTKRVKKPKSFPAAAITPAILFSQALRNYTLQEKKPSFSSNNSTNEEYMRVVSFKNFIGYTVSDNLAVNPKIPANLDLNYIGKYYKDFKNGKRYNQVNIEKLSSSNGWVFVANYNDLKQYIDDLNISLIVDCLGFYISNIGNDEYVWLKYPSTFLDLTFKPTCLTGDWGNSSTSIVSPGNEFFLSCDLNNFWGKTFSVSGTLPAVNERVHLEYDHSSKFLYEYKVNDLGKLTDIVTRCASNVIIDEALKRYSIC